MKTIAINWKNWANKELIKQFCQTFEKEHFTWFLPLTHIDYASNFDTKINIGSQNTYLYPDKTITGDITSCLLKEVNVKSILINHFERDFYYKESEKLESVLNVLAKDNFNIYICVGEKHENEFEYLKRQILIINQFLKSGLNCKIVIAYEPRWAIGTGNAASSSYVSRVIHEIKKDLIAGVLVLYGGSVNKDNAYDLMCISDGLLIGSSSRDIKQLKEIIECTKFF